MMPLSYSTKLLALALLGLLGSKMAQATDVVLLSKLDKVLTVWTEANTCFSQSRTGAPPAGSNCTDGLTEVQAGEGNITVYWRGLNSANENVATIRDAIKKVTVKACFSKESTLNRKWRKAKDDIAKDKQCFKKVLENSDYSDVTKVAHQMWKVADNVGKATFFFRVFAEDENGKAIGYGDSNDLMEDAFEYEGKTIGEAEGNTGIGYFKVKGYDGLTSGVITGVIILSVVSWTFLITYFVYENFLQKDD